MAVITDVLGIIVRGGVGEFQKDMNRASRTIRTFAAGVRSLAPAIGIGFAVSKIVNFTAEQFRAVDAIGDVATALGISTTKLQVYEQAAALSGASTEQLTIGLRFFAKTLGAAKSLDPS